MTSYPVQNCDHFGQRLLPRRKPKDQRARNNARVACNCIISYEDVGQVTSVADPATDQHTSSGRRNNQQLQMLQRPISFAELHSWKHLDTIPDHTSCRPFRSWNPRNRPHGGWFCGEVGGQGSSILPTPQSAVHACETETSTASVG